MYLWCYMTCDVSGNLRIHQKQRLCLWNYNLVCLLIYISTSWPWPCDHQMTPPGTMAFPKVRINSFNPCVTGSTHDIVLPWILMCNTSSSYGQARASSLRQSVWTRCGTQFAKTMGYIWSFWSQPNQSTSCFPHTPWF